MTTTDPGPHGPVSWPTADGLIVSVYAGNPAPGQKPKWYWNLRAANGEKIADGSQGYHRRRTAIRAARRLHPEMS